MICVQQIGNFAERHLKIGKNIEYILVIGVLCKINVIKDKGEIK